MILWTIHCPKCNILKKKLDTKGIKYELVDDRAKIEAQGMELLPVLEMDDGTRLGFGDAVKYVNELS